MCVQVPCVYLLSAASTVIRNKHLIRPKNLHPHFMSGGALGTPPRGGDGHWTRLPLPRVYPSGSKLPAHGAGGGEGECLKIVQVENGSLSELVEVFMGITRGFDVPAGTVVLLGSVSYMANMGTADYTTEFVRASGMLRGAFTGGVIVLHSIPFLLGGSRNASAISTGSSLSRTVLMTSRLHALSLQEIFAHCQQTAAVPQLITSLGYRPH